MNTKVHNDPSYWRNRAEEERAVATQMSDAHAKAIMVGTAQNENIAEWFRRTRSPTDVADATFVVICLTVKPFVL